VSGWFHLNLGDALLAGGPLARVEQGFAALYAAPGTGAGAAVFSRHESEGRLHCELNVYFSPGAATLARTLGAVPCPPPSPAGLGLLAGPPAAWAVCFPERQA